MTPPILDPAAARRRFFLWLVVRLVGLAAIGFGAFVTRDGNQVLGLALLVAGAATLLVRPKHLGLTAPPRR